MLGHPPLRFFFRDSVQMTALRAAVSAIAVWTTFPHLSSKFWVQVTSGQVTRSGQMTQPSNKFYNCVTATVVEIKI